MAAYRCSGCDVNWPQSSEFQPCAACGKMMTTDWAKTALEHDEAVDLQRRWQFEHFYREWSVERFAEELQAL